MTAAPERPLLIHRVIARLNVGGPAMHVVNLATGMEAAGWQTRLIAGSVPATEGDMEYYAAERGTALLRVASMSRELDPIGDLRALWALYRLFRRERPSVVHTHTAKAGTLGRIAAILAGVPVRIHTFHGHVLGGGYFSPARTRFFLEVERQLARGTSRLVVLTDAQAEEMSRELRVAPRERFAVVPLGLELEHFASTDRSRLRADARRSLGLEDDDLALGIVGRLVPIKNHELFLQALGKLRASCGTRVRGVIVGAGGEARERELKALAGSLGLDDSLLWLGWRKDLPALYAALDAVALTSHDEGTPVALLEALASGTPVVARDVGGVAEVLRGVGAGRVLPREAGPEDWAGPLESALTEDQVDAETRRAVAERFSVERLVRDLDALYRGELGS